MRIFSVRVSGRPRRSRPMAARSGSVAYTLSTSSMGVVALTVLMASPREYVACISR